MESLLEEYSYIMENSFLQRTGEHSLEVSLRAAALSHLQSRPTKLRTRRLYNYGGSIQPIAASVVRAKANSFSPGMSIIKIKTKLEYPIGTVVNELHSVIIISGNEIFQLTPRMSCNSNTTMMSEEACLEPRSS